MKLKFFSNKKEAAQKEPLPIIIPNYNLSPPPLTSKQQERRRLIEDIERYEKEGGEFGASVSAALANELVNLLKNHFSL